jgi:apolipoprotein N-acyltransferase
MALYAQSVWRGCLLGLTTGVVFFSGTLYWVTNVMAVYGGIPTPGAIGINALLVLYQAAYLCLFGALIAYLTARGGVSQIGAAPVVWVGLEYARTHFLSGFPWVLLGYSQASMLPIAQFASLLGIFGVSLLVISINSAVAYTFIARLRPPMRRERRSHAYTALAFTLGTVIAIGVWGSVRIQRGTLLTQGEPVTVGLIQGNVSLEDKMDARRSRGIYNAYLQMTRQAIFQGAQFVVWPESAVPFYFEEEPAAEELRRIAREARVPILLGTDQIERGQPPKYYNGAVMVDATGRSAASYQKMHLVPFGEYVPARRLFFFMERLVDAVSDFSAGTAPTLLPVNGHPVSTSICYEVVYPGAVRRFVNDGAQLLTTITNDAWFGPTSAPYQHFEQASMRAIENGRFLVRAANTGISGIVDPYGRVLQSTPLYEPAVVVGQARFLTGRTAYASIGDTLPILFLAATPLMLFRARRRIQ